MIIHGHVKVMAINVNQHQDKNLNNVVATIEHMKQPKEGKKKNFFFYNYHV